MINWKDLGFVRKSKYHELKKLKNLLLKLLNKEELTAEEKKWLEAVLKEENEEVGLGPSEGSEQIEDDLSVLRNTLKDEQVNHADTYEKLVETEQKLKAAEESQRKSETELVAEREKVVRLEAELAAARERPTAQELQEAKEERDAARNEKNQLQQELDELQTDLDEKDELLTNKNSLITDLVKERNSRPAQQQLENIQKILDKVKSEAKKWKDKYNNSDLEKKYNELLKESLNLKENNNKLKEDHEKELERLKNQNASNSDLEEKQKEIDLLKKISETLEKENQVLKETISFLKSDNPQEEQIEKKQQIVEVLEERLIDCCSECLVEKEEQKEGLREAKKEIFQLCKRLDITLPEWLEKKIENSATYRQLINNLSDIHDRKTIVEIQERTERDRQVSEETFTTTTTEPQKEIKPGVKQFFWITGILALVSSILAIVKKWKSK